MYISNHIPIILIVLPIVLSTITVILRTMPSFQKGINLFASLILFALSIVLLFNVWNNGILVYEVGEWGKYGIILVADLLSSGLVVVSSLVSLMALIYSLDYMDSRALNTTYYALFNLLVAGLNGTFLTGDIFNMFVFFEILLLSSCGLVVASGKGGFTKIPDKMEAAFKYLMLNMLGSIVMLIAIAALYATVGTLNMADIAVKIETLNAAGTMPWYIYVIALLFIVVFGNKAAIFPLHYWLPDVHPSAPSPISAMLSGIMIKVGVYGILRVCYLIFHDAMFILQPIIIILALLTIIIGAISAIGQNDVKRLLAYSSISQIGYVILGVGMGTAYALAATFVYLVNHAVAKSMLFLTAGGIIHHARTRDMRKMGGMVKTAPLMSGIFLIGSMSIAGLPPMGGFIAKFVLFDAGLLGEYYIPIIIALLFAILTLFYMFRAWLLMFWGEKATDEYGDYHTHTVSTRMAIPMVILAGIVLILGIYPEPLMALSTSIANELLDPQPYITAVLERSVR